MTLPMQQELTALLGEQCFVRRAREDDALFVSDAPLRLPTARIAELYALLAEHGYTCVKAPNGLWRIGLSAQKCRQALAHYANEAPAAFPRDTQTDVYALAGLLAAHPAPIERQPIALLYAVIKRCAEPAQLYAAAPRLLEACAIRLRSHQPLPHMAAGLLYRVQKDRCKEEEQ